MPELAQPETLTVDSTVVECHSSYKYAEWPVALHWDSQRLEIAAVEASWHTPGGERFRVRTTDGQTFELHYAERDDRWSVVQL